MIFLKSPFGSGCVELNDQSLNGENLKKRISSCLGIPCEHLLLYCNDHVIYGNDKIKDEATVHAVFRLPGGKGGFGSMLRAIGAQIEKTTNKEACRDLSGRRLRDINEEKRLKKWIAKQAERESEELERKKQKLERMKLGPKHEFKDPTYDKHRSNLIESINDALTQGLQNEKFKSGQKRTNTITSATAVSKKPRLWAGLDEEEPDSEESNDETDLPSKNQDSSEEMSSSEQTFQLGEETSNMSQDTSSSSEAFQDPDKSELPSNGEKEINLNEPSTSNASAPNIPEKAVDVNLENFNSVEELEDVGLEGLKKALIDLGMKCGGTLRQRAERLFSVKGLRPQDIPQSLLAKPSKTTKI